MDSEEGQQGLCPLETLFVEKIGTSHQKTYPLNDFIKWVWPEDRTSAIHSTIGALRSIHLMRERSTIHHEYILACFSSGLVAGADVFVQDSWLRVERAAELRARWFRPGFDSVGPLVGGAKLKESISFSTNREALRWQPDDELASVNVANPHAKESLLVYELAYQLREAAARSSKYRLFSENCRWHGRRNLQSCVDHLLEAGHEVSLLWGAVSVTPGVFRQNLAQETFGGGEHLYGEKGAHIQARLWCDLAWQVLCASKPHRAFELCEQALQLLDTVESALPRHLYLVSGVLNTKAIALRDLSRLTEAHDAHQQACEISETFEHHPEYDNLFYTTHNAMGVTLRMMGQAEEALKMHQYLISSRRHARRLKADSSMPTENLAQSLWNLSLALGCQMGPPSDPPLSTQRLQAIEESLHIYAQLYEERPDLFVQSLSSALSEHASALDAVGRTSEALPSCEESIALRRQLIVSYPGTSRPKLASELYRCAQYAAKIEEWERAINFQQDAVVEFGILAEADSQTYGQTLATVQDAGYLFQSIRDSGMRE